MKRYIPSTLAVAGVLVLAGCASQSPTASAPPVTQQPVTPASSPSSVASPVPAHLGPHFVALRKDGTKPFGSYVMYDLAATQSDTPVYNYNKDLMIQVDQLGYFTPGQYAAINGPKASKYRKYRITVTNNTTRTVTMSGLFYVAAQDGNSDAATVFDGDSIGSSPSTPLLPGRTTSWIEGFGDSHNDEVVSVTYTSPNGQYDPALFRR